MTIEQALQKAVEAHKAGKLQDAESLYRAILQAQPQHADANHNLGVLAVSLKKTEAALPLFKTALEANPSQAQFWLSYVDALIKENQFDNARNVLEQAKKSGLAGEKVDELEVRLTKSLLPQSSEASANKVSTFTQQRKKVSAKKEKKKASSSNQTNLQQARNPSQVQLNTLLEHYQKGRYDLAENLATSLTTQYPKHTFAWKMLGVLFQQTGKLQDSVIANQKVLGISPNDAEAHSNLGNTLKELGRLAEAETSYKNAIAVNPDYAQAHYNLGITRKELGRLKEAATSYKKAISIKSDYAQAHSNLGIILHDLGRLTEAETSYRNAVAIKPEFAEAHYNLGITLKELGRLEDAEASYSKAIAIKPDYAQAHSNLGIALHELGRLPDAENSYKNAIAIKPEYEQAHYNLGNTLKELGRLEEAATSYKKAIVIKPDLLEAHYNLGITLKKLGRLEEAETSYKKAIAIKSDYAEAHNNLGSTLQELGRLQDAEISYKNAIVIKPDLAEAHNNLGITLQELGRLEDAEISIQNAISIKPDYAEAMLNKAMLSICQNEIVDSILFLKKVIELDAGDRSLMANVKLAALNFLGNDLNTAKVLIENSRDILQIKNKLVKQDATYHIFLSKLLSLHKLNAYSPNNHSIQWLHVIGESHAMSSNRLYIESLKGGSLCKVHWIAGCKQWHLGNSSRNQYKEQFERVLHSIPDESTILLSIGEIDCRIDDGILKNIKKQPSKIKSTLIESTIENYLMYVYNTIEIKSTHVVIQGVPCPNIDPSKVDKNDLLILINLIRDFNYWLSAKTKKLGFEFLDLHSLTDRGDGYSNGIWNIDEYHLSPDGMLEAWRRHFG